MANTRVEASSSPSLFAVFRHSVVLCVLATWLSGSAHAGQLTAVVEGCPATISAEWLEVSVTHAVVLTAPIEAGFRPGSIRLLVVCSDGSIRANVVKGRVSQTATWRYDPAVDVDSADLVERVSSIVRAVETEAPDVPATTMSEQSARSLEQRINKQLAQPSRGYKMRERALGKRAGAIAVTVIGVLHLLVAVGLSIEAGVNGDRSFQIFEGLFPGIAGGIGGILLGVGIPSLVGALRDEKRADQILTSEEMSLHQQALQHAHARRMRRSAVALMIAGGSALALSAAGWIWFADSPNLGDGINQPALALGSTGSLSGLILLSLGGAYFDLSKKLLAGASLPKITLRPILGTTVGLAGTF